MRTCKAFPGFCSEAFPGQTCNVVCDRGRPNVPLCQVTYPAMLPCYANSDSLFTTLSQDDLTWTDIPRCIEHEPGDERQIPGLCPGISGYCPTGYLGQKCAFDCPTGKDIDSTCTADGTWFPYPTCSGDIRDTQDGCDPCPGPRGQFRDREREGLISTPPRQSSVDPFASVVADRRPRPTFGGSQSFGVAPSQPRQQQQPQSQFSNFAPQPQQQPAFARPPQQPRPQPAVRQPAQPSFPAAPRQPAQPQQPARQQPSLFDIEFQKIKEAQLRKQQERIRQQKEKEQREKAEAQLRLRQEEEARLRQQQEAELKQRREQEARIRAAQQAKLRQEQEAKIRAAQEAKLRQEQEARLRAAEQAKKQQEEDLLLRRQQEALARIKAEKEARLRQAQQQQQEPRAIEQFPSFPSQNRRQPAPVKPQAFTPAEPARLPGSGGVPVSQGRFVVGGDGSISSSRRQQQASQPAQPARAALPARRRQNPRARQNVGQATNRQRGRVALTSQERQILRDSLPSAEKSKVKANTDDDFFGPFEVFNPGQDQSAGVQASPRNAVPAVPRQEESSDDSFGPFQVVNLNG